MSPRFLGWNDDASGLDRFEVEVYLLKPGSSGTLQQLGNPERTATVTPDLNNFQFTAPRPGVYAIVVTVYDAANNSAKARKIFNYNDKPGFTETDAPVYFVEAAQRNDDSFITTLYNRRKLTLNWAGRFVTDRQYSEEFSRAVEPWPTAQDSIDDVYGTTFGLRSISAVKNLTGISTVSCTYLVDPYNGGRGYEEPDANSTLPDGVVVGTCVTNLQSETATLNFNSSLKEGDTVVVWLKASDQTGAVASKRIRTTLDVTRANISEERFLKRRDNEYESV